MEQRTEFLKMACESMRSRETKPMDNLEIWAAGWVAKLRTLDEDQQRYARMSIDQILLQGESKTLSLGSVNRISSATTFSPPQFQPLQQLLQPLHYPIQLPLQLQPQLQPQITPHNLLQPQNPLQSQSPPIYDTPPNSQEVRRVCHEDLIQHIQNTEFQ